MPSLVGFTAGGIGTSSIGGSRQFKPTCKILIMLYNNGCNKQRRNVRKKNTRCRSGNEEIVRRNISLRQKT